ncbi:MAG: hypothetical protein ACYCUX_03230 [Metallibacterium sp.]
MSAQKNAANACAIRGVSPGEGWRSTRSHCSACGGARGGVGCVAVIAANPACGNAHSDGMAWRE